MNPRVSLKPMPRLSAAARRQLPLGTSVEMEHTSSPRAARLIAAQHLAESPYYYTELVKMERRLRHNPALITTNSLGRPIANTEQQIRNFWKWFGKSKTVDKQGRPLVLYRGFRRTPKPTDFVLTANRATASFTDDPVVASVYARQLETREYGSGSQVMAAYVRMRKPLNITRLGVQPDLDQVFMSIENCDYSVSEGKGKFGYEDIAATLEYMDDTVAKVNAEYDIQASEDGVSCISDFDELAIAIREAGDAGNYEEIYSYLCATTIDAFALADNAEFVCGIYRAGYDGMIISDVFEEGAKYCEGTKASEEEEVITYRPYGLDQVKSATGNTGEFSSKCVSVINPRRMRR